ncbi:serine O-acetyltransferase EpsC [Desulfoluna butyratoxydans]|uniref:Trimeric lpxa-like n=1 Tax=Desulfoluna butyratoxydans TaxID=231438 RepID=A0A4U8YQT3_9BACT|nr:serine O-acetyltransferase EpsC [Desulfoluna butyratoxydans]VFQ45629.1 trimeric lpxa-like [Desulfoluna butyratoxydans]
MNPIYPQEADRCRSENESIARFRRLMPDITREIIDSCNEPECFKHVGYEPIPSRHDAKRIIKVGMQVLFPGYFAGKKIDPLNLTYRIGQLTTTLYDLLTEQVVLSFRHDCYRYNKSCTSCASEGHEAVLEFFRAIPDIKRTLAEDVRATRDGDPAAHSVDEIIFSYPGVYAISVYRMAHKLYELGVPILPRIMTEIAHSATGIDIHPGARIGKRFAIDHGTGVVIGETTLVGENVRIYQGVTLGALSLPPGAGEHLKGKKRHPTIEDNAIIYSGATILGGKTTIGRNCTIGGNVWLTTSVPADTKVFIETPELIYMDSNGSKTR